MQSEALIQSFIEQTRQHLNRAAQLNELNIDELNWRARQDSWCILECLEHLNLYGNYYLPEMEKEIGRAKKMSAPEFRSGMLGGYFAKMMLPKEKLKKMKTFKDKNPIHNHLDKSVIDRFIRQQHRLLELLNRARVVDLSHVRITTSISKMIRLKLGDTFAFYINHILRHLRQVERVQAAMAEMLK